MSSGLYYALQNLDIAKTDEHSGRKNERWMLCWAINEVLGGILGENLADEEPHLTDPDDETSDFIAGFDFGDGFFSCLTIPFYGKAHFENPTLRQMVYKFRHRIMSALDRLVPNPDEILEERL